MKTSFASGRYETFLSKTVLVRYLVQVPTAFTTAAKSWILRHVSDGSSVYIRDFDSACLLGVFGPKSEELLQSLTQTSLRQNAFPLDTFKVTTVYKNVRLYYNCNYNFINFIN